jgi:hypothetical protein
MKDVLIRDPQTRHASDDESEPQTKRIKKTEGRVPMNPRSSKGLTADVDYFLHEVYKLQYNFMN